MAWKKTKKPNNWLDAFLLLEKYLQKIDDGSRQLIFFDEFPWLDTPKSGFITAFEAFWNNWACHRKNLMLIVCGSANSWILDKLINNHGGLYNRVTYEMKLSPFSLSECEEFYKNNNILLSRYDIVQSYMINGGIPYYLGYMKPGLSLAQNIDEMYFKRNATLKDEYVRLFTSVFVNPVAIMNIVKTLSTRNYGYTRKEIVEKMNITDGGRLSGYLNSLVASDFIIKYVPFGKGKREEHYKLIDPFCIFYLNFIDKKKHTSEKFWQENINSQSLSSWRGVAFENVCFNHVEQIKNALGVSGVASTNSAWNDNSENGMQIDLIISRNDNVINMCELKYYSSNFVVDKEYYKLLLNRKNELEKYVSKKASIYSTLVTTFGLKPNENSTIFTNIITIDDLFI